LKGSGPCWGPVTIISSPRYYNNPNDVEFNAERTKPYHSLNMNWSLLLKQHVILYFTVSNILGYEQEFGRSYAAMSRTRTGAITANPFFLRPNAGSWWDVLLPCPKTKASINWIKSIKS
jgi:hypothetical protein